MSSLAPGHREAMSRGRQGCVSCPRQVATGWQHCVGLVDCKHIPNLSRKTGFYGFHKSSHFLCQSLSMLALRVVTATVDVVLIAGLS